MTENEKKVNDYMLANVGQSVSVLEIVEATGVPLAEVEHTLREMAGYP